MRTETIFRALADATRLRILRLLGEMELAVGELAQVLGQSQPRVSRHVAILCDAGLAERRKEGSWVFLRACSSAASGSALTPLFADLLERAEVEDADFGAQCHSDRRRLSEIRSAREAHAGEYFARHADEWDDLRRLYGADSAVERKLTEALTQAPLGRLLDIGTGTGRMAELFAPHASHIVALDKSLDMLRVARAKLQHLPAESVELIQGDFADLPFEAGRFDTVLLHQVLHFAQDPMRAITEAARVTRAGGRIAVIDFAAHEREELRTRHAHTRLGFEDADMAEAFTSAGYRPADPIAVEGGELAVMIWSGERTGTAGSPANDSFASDKGTTRKAAIR